MYPNEFDIIVVNTLMFSINDLHNLKEYPVDFIMFNTMLGLKHEHPLLAYLAACLHFGAKIILDIDDHYQYGRSVTIPKEAKTEHAIKASAAIKEADYVTTTTDLFATKLMSLNKNVEVFPNFADANDAQYKPNKITHRDSTGRDIIRIGITGSVMHKYDIEILSGITYRLKKDGMLDRVEFVLCGYANNPTFIGYEKILTSDYRIISRDFMHNLKDYKTTDIHAKGEPYRRIGWRNVLEYMTVYNELDVLLAPLENSEFNEAKSQIKYIEAAWMNVLFVGSDIPTYNVFVTENKNNGFLCKDREEFYQNIKYIIKNWDATDGFKEIRNNAALDVRANYEAEVITRKRRDYLHKIKAEKDGRN